MADWFKFRENDLDETRLQYAISKLPEVVSVWVGILSECCRHKSETFRWGDNEIELFGFSRRLGISIPKVNEAVNLLSDIDYITRASDSITVIEWKSKQSEYCQKKSYSRDSVPTLSGECRPRGEDRRGDKNRIDKSIPVSSGLNSLVPKDETVPALIYKSFQKPDLEAVKLQAQKIGLPESEAVRFWNYYESNGWKVGKNPMKQWTSALSNWNLNWKERGGHTQSAGAAINGAQTVVAQKEFDRVSERMKTIRCTYGDHQTWADGDREEFLKLKARKIELKELLGIKA